jgi:hypothetical protein
VTSLIINRTLSAFARATGKVAGQATRWTLALASLFFEAIVEARATMARRQVIGSVAGVASNERHHGPRPEAVHRLSSQS